MPRQKRQVYLDHAATTPLDTRVLKAMGPFLTSEFANPSALYDLGVRARQAIEESRKTIADIIHATSDTITFTSGGTEANNLAILGVTKAKKGHIITTPIEHDSVLGPIEQLKKEGCKITYLKVDRNGFVDPKEVIQSIRPESILVSVMYANNEIGTIEPIAEIGRMILRYRREHNTLYPYFHTDACQAAGYLDLDVEKLHVDLMTVNGSKIYGPKGVGILYVRRGVKIEPIIYGGDQERGLRPGTENIAGIVGLGKALEIVQELKGRQNKNLIKLNTYFWQALQKSNVSIKLNGPEIKNKRLANNLNIQFSGIDAETLLLYLNEAGIMCSTGSACGLNSGEPSHVLAAIGLMPNESKSSLRFSIGSKTSVEDLKYVVKQIQKKLSILRA